MSEIKMSRLCHGYVSLEHVEMFQSGDNILITIIADSSLCGLFEFTLARRGHAARAMEFVNRVRDSICEAYVELACHGMPNIR